MARWLQPLTLILIRAGVGFAVLCTSATTIFIGIAR
jgi:hypothetical protein